MRNPTSHSDALRASGPRNGDSSDSLHALARQLGQTRSVADVAAVILAHGAALGATGGMVAVLASDQETLRLAGSLGRAEDLAPSSRIAVDADHPIASAFRLGEPVVDRRTVAIPLLVEGRAIGGIALRFDPAAREPMDRAAMSHLAHECGLALDRARLREEVAAAERERREFLALLSHELRNPLAPIRTAARILELRPSEDPAVERSREVIQRQVAHLSRLIDDLLDSSRIAFGRIRLELELLDLVPLVREVVNDHRELFHARQVDLRLDAPCTPISVRADRVRLAQAITNLLVNAAKFTDPGGRVGIELALLGGRAEIRVHDTGIGMRKEVLPRVFEPFAQGDRRTDRASTCGLGLGLALVERIVTLHGGTVAAKSAGPGCGSEFTIALPVSPVPADAARSSSRMPAISQRILLIEDNLDAAETLATYLEMIGHEVQVANDGTSGIAAARSFRPDVVLCDIGLPGPLDGYAIARALREDPQLSETLLIALTGFGREQDRALSRESGFDLHATKPIDPKALASLLAEPIDRRN